MAGEQKVGERATLAVGGGEVLSKLDPIAIGTALLKAMARPSSLARELVGLVKEDVRIAAGRSEVAPAKGDWRFADPAWKENPLYRRLGQSYLAWAEAVTRLVEDANLEWREAERARFAGALLTTSVAPTNFLPGNPAAIKRAFDTGGMSLLRGARNWARDRRENGGMPAQVDRRPFRIGENMAATPGAVVHRNDLLEVIQYTPTSTRVHSRPVLMIPPQINKYYVLDLAPGRSFIEHVVSQGTQTFAISWRNPRPEHRGWDLDTYIEACLEAVDVVCAVSGSEDLNVFGLCAGGMTAGLMLAYMASKGDERAKSATFAVTIVDFGVPSLIGMFGSAGIVDQAKKASRKKGMLGGRELSNIFLWLRPNDLVWNYWVNNYLMGNDPPAFDILAWNADPTNLTAGLHADFLDIFSGNSLVNGSGLSVLGRPVSLADVRCDNYIVGGLTDHLVPWQACYRGTQVIGGPSTFVLTGTGHIQSIINAPGDPKMRLWKDGPEVADPDRWLAGATLHHPATWWEDWGRWVGERGGAERTAPAKLGNRRYKPLDPAPGTYLYASC